MSKDKVKKSYKNLGRYSMMGKSKMLIECECGFRSFKYLWSWAGHGKTYCPGCKGVLMYNEGKNV